MKAFVPLLDTDTLEYFWLNTFYFMDERWKNKNFFFFSIKFPTYTCFASATCTMAGRKPEQFPGSMFQSTKDRKESILRGRDWKMRPNQRNKAKKKKKSLRQINHDKRYIKSGEQIAVP